jgi:hypothetical protein
MDPWRSVHAARIRAYLSTGPQSSRNLDSAKPVPRPAGRNRSQPIAPVIQGPWPQERPQEPRMCDR